MNSRIKFYIFFIVSAVFLAVICCDRSESLNTELDTAEKLMEQRPDTALSILNSLDVSLLNGKRDKARYALLKSIALDKNYVDTTTFDVLQPAIDYYLLHGTADEKLRTYYYQGRIYQNMNERDSALRSFRRGLDIADGCKDSLTIARTLVVQGILYKSYYDIEGYTDNYLKAANIFNKKNSQPYEFDCLLNALNGMNMLGKKEQADSIIKLIEGFDFLDDAQKQRLHSHIITYVLKFGSKQDLKNLVGEKTDNFTHDSNGILNIVRVLNRLDDDEIALQQLDYLDEAKSGYDTLKYLSIKYPILEQLGQYKEALAIYKDYSIRLETANSGKFEQKSRSMEEKHQMELKAEREAEKTRKLTWTFIGCLVFLIMGIGILSLLMRRNKIKKELVVQKAHAVELENKNLKTEREKLTLENINLQLERDNKTLEAENLMHRVETLESESENLKELLQNKEDMPEEVRKAIQTRIEMLNSYLASQISDHKEFEESYDAWVAELTANTEEFMNSNRLAFQASHPSFIKYFEDHGLTTAEINYVCLYAIGLRGKDVGNYMKKRSHVNISSAIRKKLGIDKHETNIGIYVRKLLKNF